MTIVYALIAILMSSMLTTLRMLNGDTFLNALLVAMLVSSLLIGLIAVLIYVCKRLDGLDR